MRNGPTFKALLNSNSMARTVSESDIQSLLHQCPDIMKQIADDYVIVGCAGHRGSHKDIYDLDFMVYGCRMMPIIVPGQTEQMILDSNAIKQTESSEKY